MDILAKLFGTAARVRVMRLFLMNPEEVFDIETVVGRTRTAKPSLRKEINLLKNVGLIKEVEAVRMVPDKKKSVKKVVKTTAKKAAVDVAFAMSEPALVKERYVGYAVDAAFPFYTALRALVTEIAIGKDDISSRFKGTGQYKLIVVAGVFIDEASRVDMLLVGDKLNRSGIERELRKLEAEIGKELSYSIMDSAEFEYRFGIYDKFVRDIIDYPHLVVLNKINLF
jgi:hypothetical protein